MGGPENGNFPLLYEVKMSLRREWVVLKSLKTSLRNIKMVPNQNCLRMIDYQCAVKPCLADHFLSEMVPFRLL